MSTTPEFAPVDPDARKLALNKRLEEIGWGLFLLMTGTLWLLPEERVPSGTWLLGAGVLLLALNAVRYVNGLAVSLFTTALGVLALAGGLADLVNMPLPLFAVFLIVFGAALALKPLVRPRT